MPTTEDLFRSFTAAQLQGFQAECDSRKDKQLQRFERAGLVKEYDCAFGNSYYSLTEAGRRALTCRD